MLLLLSLTIIITIVAVDLSNEHKVTVEAGQDDPHGTSIEVVDRSFIGDASAVRVESVKNKKS